jgi:GT2 family glycosyltransferase
VIWAYRRAKVYYSRYLRAKAMSIPSVSIIIPVFNQWRYTTECLEALRTHTSAEIPFEVVIVDNASTDETASGLREWQTRWPLVRVETLSENTGFSPACNHGAQVSRGEYLLFLNNDTIPQPGWLEPLLNEIKESGVGIVGPKLVYPDGKSINHAGYVFGLGFFYSIYHEHHPGAPEVNKKRDYQALLGACILISRELFFTLGAFALDGLEDIDLCLKAGAKSLCSRYVPASTVYHHGSVTLVNSAPGTFPVTSQIGFNQRWDTFSIVWDDYRWYLEDGIWPGPPEAPSPSARLEIANRSMSKLEEAYKLRNQGEFGAALQKVDAAFSLWPSNPMALLLRCQLLERTGRIPETREELLEFGNFSFCRGPVLMELMQLAERVV